MLLVEAWRDGKLVGTSEFEVEDAAKQIITTRLPIKGLQVGDKLVYRCATPQEVRKALGIASL